MKISREIAIGPIRLALSALLAQPQNTDPGLFGGTIEEAVPSLQTASDIADGDLARLYGFADYYCYCAAHGDPTVGSRTREEAEQILRRALEYLNGKENRLPQEIMQRRLKY